MNKTFCDRCKKDISQLKIYEVVSLRIEDLKQYALNDKKSIEYSKTLCPECAIDFINIVDIECDRYKLKTSVEEDKQMLSKERIKKIKEGLERLDDYYRDYGTDEDGNIIDEECYENSEIINDATYYIEKLEADNYEANNIINEYIEDRKKLIEKLEEIINETSEGINPEVMKKYSKINMNEIDNETYILLAIHRIGFAGEILEIVKGN